jgi:uncharacterized protein (TIGR00661 family)
MRILYGVTGEGMGHATRSDIVISHLRSQGHDVTIATSGGAFKYLRELENGSSVLEIPGLELAYEDQIHDYLGTLAKNAIAIPKQWARANRIFNERIKPLRFDVVLTDFEPYTYIFAKWLKIPVISIDNQQVISRCELPSSARIGCRLDYALARAFIRSKMPACKHYFITSFFRPHILPKYASSTSIVPPIVSYDVQRARAWERIAHVPRDLRNVKDSTAVLVYHREFGAHHSEQSNANLCAKLATIKSQYFYVYGRGAARGAENVEFCEFDRELFLKHLQLCKAVICNGGLSLIHEAIVLRKPILSIPVLHQYEQMLNAYYVEERGFGMWDIVLTSELIRAFLHRWGEFRARLLEVNSTGDQTEFFTALDKEISKWTMA